MTPTELPTLAGRPGSPGRAVGRALVVHDLVSARVCSPNDIIVTRAVSPEWIRVVVSCSAIVTEIGGVTSHAANMCRELRKPAVVATADAMNAIRTGDTISVNGDTGIVTVLTRSDEIP
jgi:phosphoenolpyruvate synthase/pyruvate phosphate dikinase